MTRRISALYVCAWHEPDERCGQECAALRREMRKANNQLGNLWRERRSGVRPIDTLSYRGEHRVRAAGGGPSYGGGDITSERKTRNGLTE